MPLSFTGRRLIQGQGVRILALQMDWVVKLLLRSWQRNASVVGLSDFRGKKEREEKGREEGEFFVQKSEVAKIAEATSNAQKRRHRR